MAFRNTSERYEYIFGSNARKLDRTEELRRDYGSEFRDSRRSAAGRTSDSAATERTAKADRKEGAQSL